MNYDALDEQFWYEMGLRNAVAKQLDLPLLDSLHRRDLRELMRHRETSPGLRASFVYEAAIQSYQRALLGDG